MIFVVFLVVATLFRLIIGRYFPLIGDEGFYWLWSQRLDFSYVDHPPMIAYYIKGLTLIFGNTEFAIRFGAVLLVTVITILVYQIGKELFGKKVGVLSAIIFNLTPTFFGGSIFLVPQQPFLLFWTLSLLIFVKLIKTGQAKYWYWLGLTVGLGLLSDYVMILFFPAVGLCLLFNEKLKFWWTRLQPYLAGLLSFVIFSPVIIWNLSIKFAPVSYWAGRKAATPNYLQNILNFLSLELLLYTPILLGVVFLLLYWLIKRNKILDNNILLLASFSAPVFLAFLILSPFLNIGGHWPAAAYITAILFLGQLNSKRSKILVSTALAFAILVNVLAFTYYLFLYPTPSTLKGQESTINQQLPEFIMEVSPKRGITYYVANNLGVAGLVSFHGKVDCFMPAGKLKQFDLWGQPELKRGDNVVYFAHNKKEIYWKLVPLFYNVQKEHEKRLFTKDSDIPNKLDIYICSGFKGGNLP